MNYVSILVASIAAMVVGFIWYSPMLFAREWMKSIGMTEKDMKNGMGPMTMGMAFVGVLVMNFVLDWFFAHWGAGDLVTMVKVAGFAWLGFMATVSWTTHLFQKRSVKFMLIEAGHNLAVLLVATLVFFYMGV